jgi:pimeloyl-ACP methyl ester carboxylesterase
MKCLNIALAFKINKMKNSSKSFKNGGYFICLLFALLLANFSVNAQVRNKNVVLVHGAFADGSGWEGVYKLLVASGFKVGVVANPNTSLENDVAATKLVIDRMEGPVMLVGHSYGGAIITEAGNHPKVAGLVYIAAFVPDEGESMLALLQAGPPNPSSGILPPVDGYVWYDKEKFHAGFCADISKEKAAFMADSQVPVSASVFASTIKQAAWKTKKSWYIVATEDHTIPPDAERFMAKRAGAVMTEIKGSHVVFISQPKAVAEVIMKAVAAVAN